VFDRAFAAMESLIDTCPNERHLLHSDLLYYNVLVSNDQVSSVLDWGSSLYGDFLWDLAWFTFWQPWYTAWASVDIRGAAERHFGVTNFGQRMRCYELAIGLDGMAYQAFVGHADNLAWTTERVRGLISATA
jgi:hygromycin-B 4-O-kinase